MYLSSDLCPFEWNRIPLIGRGNGGKAGRLPGLDAALQMAVVGQPEKYELASFDKLNTARRQNTFDEVVKGLDETNALYEARRCLSCGNCFECDNCHGACPSCGLSKLQRIDFLQGRRSCAKSVHYCQPVVKQQQIRIKNEV